MGSRKGTRQRGAPQQQKRGRGDESLLRQAYDLHRQGKVRAAQQAYEAFLERFPRHGEALGNFGLLLHGQGRCEEAVALYRQALLVAPERGHLHACLARALDELGRPTEAIPAYEQALLVEPGRPELLLQLGRLFFEQQAYDRAQASFAALIQAAPDQVDAHFNLALCHKALGQTELALVALEQARQRAPQDADILYNIGVIQRQEGETAAAEASFIQALALEPANGICLTDLAILYHAENRLAEADAMYERALACGYQPDSARHMLAALRGETTVGAPHQHVRDLFDNYAGSFESSLVEDLHYRVPAQLAANLQATAAGLFFEAALDLGCGTGLAGQAFRDRVGHLAGVDLSANMLALAEAKGLYDQLHCGAISDFLAEPPGGYDLVLATDVLVYLGELTDFFKLLAPVLKPGGFLLFSVESCPAGYCLRRSGRYAHAPDYITGLLADWGLTLIHCQATGIRQERGAWIPGELYIVQRP